MRAASYAAAIVVGVSLLASATAMGPSPAAWVLYALGAFMVATVILHGVSRA